MKLVVGDKVKVWLSDETLNIFEAAGYPNETAGSEINGEIAKVVQVEKEFSNDLDSSKLAVEIQFLYKPGSVHVYVRDLIKIEYDVD